VAFDDSWLSPVDGVGGVAVADFDDPQNFIADGSTWYEGWTAI
jgi:hypothetical protein